MEDPLEHADVSVALCTHNGAVFVAEQVASILAQRPAPREIVVGDDASSDATIEIIERAVVEARAAESGLRTELLVLRRESPLGVTANFDATIAACRAEVVALSDQDDVWPLQSFRARCLCRPQTAAVWTVALSAGQCRNRFPAHPDLSQVRPSHPAR